MKAIWALAVLAVASADVSHLGYHYKVPQTSYGVPSYENDQSHNPYVVTGFGSSKGQYLGSTFSHGDHGVPSHLTGDAHSSASHLSSGVVNGFGSGSSSSFGSGSSSGFESGLNKGYGSGNTYGGGSNSGYNVGYNSGINNGFGYGSSSGSKYSQTYGGSSGVAQPIYVDGSSSQYHNTQYQSGEKYQQYYQVQSQQPAQVFKHFYVHAAPEEPEVPKPRTPIVLPPPQKHYKIIFVKTPNTDTHNSQIVPVQPQNEEKTIVYVLVKKPEEHNEVIVPKVEQKPPTKPEVFFIKYSNKEDSQAVINNIVNDYNKPGQSVSFTTGGGSEGSTGLTGLPPSSLSGSGYVNYNTVPSSNLPSGSSLSGFSTGYQNYPSSSTFTNTPTSNTFASLPASLSTVSGSGSSYEAPSISNGFALGTTSVSSDSSVNDKFSSSGTNSGFSSGSNAGFSSESNSDFSSTSNSGVTSGSSSSNLFGSSQFDSSAQAPIVSTLGTQSFGVSTSEIHSTGSDSGTDSSSLVSTPVGATPLVSGQDEINTITATHQGLPHETYGVPKFREVV